MLLLGTALITALFQPLSVLPDRSAGFNVYFVRSEIESFYLLHLALRHPRHVEMLTI